MRDANYLLSLEPDRLLSGFRVGSRLEAESRKIRRLGVARHCRPHPRTLSLRLLTDVCQHREPEFLERVNYIVAQLAECQDANGDGYVAAIPDGKRIFPKSRAVKFVPHDFNLNGAWVPWYTIHKEFAGLIDAYQFCGNAQALEVATNFADWVDATTKNLTEAQWQKMLVCEQGGMNEALANLYALTGNTNYLNLAEKFNHQAVMDPLARGEDRLDGLHSNTQIPKIIGAARLYELTGEPRYADIARFFWDRRGVASFLCHRRQQRPRTFLPDELILRVILMPPPAKPAAPTTCSSSRGTCLQWSPAAAEMDFYERALYNDILASQDPDTGMFVYFMSLKPGHFKTYSTPENSFWCCVGTGMENHSEYGDTIYFHGDDSLFVNLFIASELSWPDKGLVVRQETKFPDKRHDAADFPMPAAGATGAENPLAGVGGKNSPASRSTGRNKTSRPARFLHHPGSRVAERRRRENPVAHETAHRAVAGTQPTSSRCFMARLCWPVSWAQTECPRIRMPRTRPSL